MGHSLQGKGESGNVLVGDVLDTYSSEADEGAKDNYVYKGISFNLCVYGTVGSSLNSLSKKKNKITWWILLNALAPTIYYLAYSELLLFFWRTFICFKVHQASLSLELSILWQPSVKPMSDKHICRSKLTHWWMRECLGKGSWCAVGTIRVSGVRKDKTEAGWYSPSSRYVQIGFSFTPL